MAREYWTDTRQRHEELPSYKKQNQMKMLPAVCLETNIKKMFHVLHKHNDH